MEKYVIKRTKAYEVFDKLMYAYQHKKFPYNLPTAQPPQIIENMPKGLVFRTREHACYLFCLCYYMRGEIRSDVAM